MKNSNKLFKAITFFFDLLEELLSRVISLGVTLVLLGGLIALLVLFYKVISPLLATAM